MSKRKAEDDANTNNSKVQNNNIKLIIRDEIFYCKKEHLYNSLILKNMLDSPETDTLTLDEDPKYMSVVLDIMKYGNSSLVNQYNYYHVYILLDKYNVQFDFYRDYIIDLCVKIYPISGYSIQLVFDYWGSEKDKDEMCRRYTYKMTDSSDDDDPSTFNGFDIIPQYFYLHCATKYNKNSHSGNLATAKFIFTNYLVHVTDEDIQCKIKKLIMESKRMKECDKIREMLKEYDEIREMYK
jgi:hypothetical protein